jgi:anti-sigma factor RsiW
VFSRKLARHGIACGVQRRALDGETAAAIEAHVHACPACARILAGQRSVSEALDLWEAPPVSADFDRRLYRRIEQEVPWWDFLLRPFRPRLGARFLPITAAAGLLVAAGLWIERPGEVPAPASRSAQVDALPPDQAASALEDMQMVQEFSNLVRQDSADPRL